MKALRILIVFAFLISSCKKDPIPLNAKIVEIEASISAKETQILEAQKTIETLSSKLKNKKDSINYYYVHRDFIKKTFLNGTYFSKKPKDIIVQFLNEKEINSECGFEYTLFLNRLLLKKEEDYKKLVNQENASIVDKAIYYFDRDAANISSFFSNTMLTLISQNLPLKTYKNSGLKYSLEALVKAYENLNKKELARLYEVCNLKEFPAEEFEDGINTDVNIYKMNFINKLASQEVITILRQDPNYEIYNFNAYDRNISDPFETCKVDGMPNKLFYTYSFWARRYKEENNEVVYIVLKKIISKMNNKK